MTFSFCRLLSVALALAIAPFAMAQTSLPVPLESKDPDKPLELVDDQTWSGDDVLAVPGSTSRMTLKEFRHEADKGLLTVVVDYAIPAPAAGSGEASIDIGIECIRDQSNAGCAVPVSQAVVTFRTEYMGESAAIINGQPQPVLVGREFRSYALPTSMVGIFFRQLERKNLEPRLIRTRVFYGQYDDAALPGRTTRGGNLLKFGAGLALVILAFWWWRRRQ
jgi:hypothetical protein